MANENATGFYGKLPAHGDFIYRDLSNGFINVWDEWLQGFVGGTREQIGEDWLNVYLTSPIWRFAFSAGAIDEKSWAGIMLPSVDRVGRHFPFTIATYLPPNISPSEFICSNTAWYESIENLALQALDGQIVIEDLVSEINLCDLYQSGLYRRTQHTDQASASMVFNMAAGKNSEEHIMPLMLDASLMVSMVSYSIWSTQGSERVNPCMFVSKGLPKLTGIAAMMDGQWAHWAWQEPYLLKTLT